VASTKSQGDIEVVSFIRNLLGSGSVKRELTLWWYLRQLRSKDSATRLQAAERLGNLNAPQVAAVLVASINDDDQQVRMAIVDALRKIGDTQVIEPLVQSLYDKDSNVRYAVVETLEALGWKPVDNEQRACSAIAHNQWDEAANLGVCAVRPLLRVAKEDQDKDMKQAAQEALMKIGDAAFEAIVADLNHSYLINMTAIALLSRIGDVRAVNPLADHLTRVAELLIDAKNDWGRDPVFTLSVAPIMLALMRFGERAVEPLAQALKVIEKDKIPRGVIVWNRVTAGSPTVVNAQKEFRNTIVELLDTLLNSPDSITRETAGLVLKQTGYRS
jgi:HEAT repeat protein